MVLRVSEVYLSVQGEGPRVGKPTVFVRFGGCNLRCPGWPCDTQYAIDPKYRAEWRKEDPVDLVEEIREVALNRTSTSICFTGGEPFLQPKDDLASVVSGLRDVGYNTFEAFSNGTLLYPDWAARDIAFIMDWKLPGSGEDMNNENRFKNLRSLGKKDAVKFVIKDRSDYVFARESYRNHIEPIDACIRPRTYYGVVWGALENKELIEWVLEDRLDWYMNYQIHNVVWPRDERAR